MTDAEQILWSRIRRKQLKSRQFYRQKIIGNYITDFYCPKSKLIIEIDGGQHYSEQEKKKDKIRDDYMSKIGLKVLRFSDNEIFKNLEDVIDKIYEFLGILKSPLTPLFQRGEIEIKELLKCHAIFGVQLL